ncbi:hypothetical protein [Flagellimonas lutimaris]|nr:hypothetical protein [Allomuricauda lutimaris]
MKSAIRASKKAMGTGVPIPISETIEEGTMTIRHFVIFNSIE